MLFTKTKVNNKEIYLTAFFYFQVILQKLLLAKSTVGEVTVFTKTQGN